MAIEVSRKDRETSSSLLRRFSRRVQQSGILINARKARFFSKSKTKREQKASALRREILRQHRVKLIRQGLLEEGEMIPQEQLPKNK